MKDKNINIQEEGDELLKLAGLSGKFQRISCIFIIGYSFVMFYNVTSLPFQKIRPKALCRIKDDAFQHYQECSYENYCDPNYEKIILREESYLNWTLDFNVDCEQEKNFEFIISSIFLGGFLSILILSVWADIYGRKKVLQFEIYTLIVIIILALFSTNLYMVCILWFFYEFCNHMFSLLLIYASETMSQQYFSYVCSMSNVAFPATGLVTSLLFITIKNWRIIHFIFICLALTCGIIFKLMIIESPKFSLEKRDLKTFIITVKKIASINNTEKYVSEKLKEFEYKYIISKERTQNFEDLKGNTDYLAETKNLSFFEAYKTDPILKKEFNIVVYMYTVIQLVFFGVLLNIEKFDENVFLFSIILYSSEMIAEFISGILAQKFGRKIVIIISFYISGTSFIMFHLFNNIFYLRVFFCFWGNYGVSSCFNTVLIYMSETFDVSIRATASAYCKIPSQFVVIFSPYIISFIPFPFICFGILLILAGYSMNFCKETLTKENANQHYHGGH